MPLLPALTTAAVAQCVHGAPASLISGATKVMFAGAPVMLSGDQVTIAGCPFTVPPGKPQPCATGKLSTAAMKVLVEGKPVMLQGPGDLGISPDQIPGGPLIYGLVQAKVLLS